MIEILFIITLPLLMPFYLKSIGYMFGFILGGFTSIFK